MEGFEAVRNAEKELTIKKKRDGLLVHAGKNWGRGLNCEKKMLIKKTQKAGERYRVQRNKC